MNVNVHIEKVRILKKRNSNYFPQGIVPCDITILPIHALNNKTILTTQT